MKNCKHTSQDGHRALGWLRVRSIIVLNATHPSITCLSAGKMPAPLQNLGIVECLITGKMPAPLQNLGIVERAGEPVTPKLRSPS